MTGCSETGAANPPKSAGYSRVIMSHMMLPQDANPAGIVHGGVVMKHIDDAAGVVALRHTRCNVVTASIDRLDFHNPAFIGNLLTLKTGEVRHTASAYLTFVALNDGFRPRPVPPLVLETDEDRRRNRQAQARRRVRLAEKTRETSCRTDPDTCFHPQE
jgi:acyl-CoA hydrolase